MKKTRKPKRDSLRSAIKGNWRERLYEQGIIVKQPISKELLIRYGNLFVEFCLRRQKEESLKSDNPLPFYIEEWLFEEGIPDMTHNKWMIRSPEYKELITQGYRIMGTHQEAGAAIRKFSEGTIHKNLHVYLDRWKNSEEYHDDREIRKRQKEVEAYAKINVTRERYT